MPIAAAIKANYRPSADRAVGAQLLNIIRSIAVFLDRQSAHIGNRNEQNSSLTAD